MKNIKTTMAIPLIFKRIAIIIPFLTQDKDGPVLKTKKEDDYFLVTLFFVIAGCLELSGDFAHKFATAAAEFERAGSNCVILGINAVAVRKQQEIISVAVKVKGLGHSCYLA